jgi:hypothetical protein
MQLKEMCAPQEFEGREQTLVKLKKQKRKR